MISSLGKVVERWRQHRIDLLPPADEPTIISALNSTRRKFARDVVYLYTVVGGMIDGVMDEEMFALWSLERIVAENAEYERPYLLFADFLIDSHLYCLKRENDEQSAVFVEGGTGQEPERVASSLEEFFSWYMTDLRKIWL